MRRKVDHHGASLCQLLIHEDAHADPQALGRRIPFAFIEDTQQHFFAAFGDGAQTAAAYEYEAHFSRVRRCTGRPQLRSL